MFDIMSNHKIVYVRAHASQGISTVVSAVVDLMAEAEHGLHERNTGGLLLIEVTDVNSTGTLDIVVQDSPDGVTYDADFATIEQITAAGLYAVVLKGMNRYVRFSSVVASAAVVWGAIGVSFDAERRPVKQASATELEVTYGTGR